MEGAADVAAGRLLIVLDSSWSMLARTSSGETRWERGIAEARRLLAAGSGGEIALATTADGLVEGPTTDRTLIETALDRARPGADEGAAWPRLAGAPSVHFITDGAIPRPLDSRSSCTRCSSRPPTSASPRSTSVPRWPPGARGTRISRSRTSPPPQKVRLTLVRGTATIFNDEFDIAASEALRQVVPIARGGDPRLRARVEARTPA